ncbi:MAG: sugar phosphate isomerase/epimerase family protein [Eubacteriales bacterium]|jgi:L-ribulose-5-phosphate 3-epimerase
MKISVMTASFREGFEGGVRRAAQMGADGIQMYASESGLDFTRTPIQPCADGILKFVTDAGLEISAVCVDIGGFACDAAEVPERIKRTKNMLLFTKMMGVKNVTSHIGKIPDCKHDPIYVQLKAALTEIGDFCVEHGLCYNIETGPEKAIVLKEFLEDVASPGLGVNLDPANFVMCSDQDPVEAVHMLGKYIHHTHAKDGICLWREVHKEWPNVPEGRKWIEVPLGSGEVDFPAWIKALREEGYDGFLAIEREAGDDPYRDIKIAFDFLKTLI